MCACVHSLVGEHRLQCMHLLLRPRLVRAFSRHASLFERLLRLLKLALLGGHDRGFALQLFELAMETRQRRIAQLQQLTMERQLSGRQVGKMDRQIALKLDGGLLRNRHKTQVSERS